MSVNKQILIGFLGKDPDVRTFQDGTKACRFTVAVTEKGYTAQNGQQVPEHTEWFNILVRGKKAEVAEQYLHRGDKVYIEGRTYTGEYRDQSGQQMRYTEVRCEVLELLSPKNQSQQQQAQQSQYQQQQQAQQNYQQQQAPPSQYQQQVGVYGQTAQVPYGQTAQTAPANDRPW